MKVPKVPRLPRKSSLRCWKCHACHVEDSRRPWVHLRRQASADIYEGTERATPATQIAPEVLKVSRLPRRRQSASMGPPSSPSFRGHLWRYRKCHACHANRAWGAESVTCHVEDSRRPWVHLRRSADIYEGTESTTPATQIAPAVLKASRLPRTRPSASMGPPSSPSFRGHLWRCRKYHACHANRAWDAESVTPATSKTVGVHGSTFVAKLPRTSMKVPKVPRLPCKSSLRCWKCHACHVEDSRRPCVHRRRQASADIYEGTESATPATQIEPEVLKCHACHVEDSRRPWVHRRRQASADIYEGTESATPATQIEPEVLKVSRLPRRRQSASMGPPLSPIFRGYLWRYRKCHACHTNRAWGAESVTPAT